MRHVYGKLYELFTTYVTPQNIVIILKEINRQIGSVSYWVIALCIAVSIFSIIVYLRSVSKLNKSEKSRQIYSHLLLDVLLLCCIVSILEITVFSREFVDIYECNFQLFYVYQEKVYTETIILQDILNVCLFIPFGLLCGIRFRKCFLLIRSIICSMAVSLLVECLQWKFSRGMFDVDDLFFNTVGGFLGALGFSVIYTVVRLRRYLKNKVRK